MKIIFLVGISGAGKSTFREEYIKKNPNTIIISRDNLRVALFGNSTSVYYTKQNIKTCENVITQIADNTFLKALYNGFDIVVDNTNLKYEYIENFLKQYRLNFNSVTGKAYDINFKLFDVALNDAKARVLMRDFNYTSAPENINEIEEVKYINKQFTDYLNIKKHLLKTVKKDQLI